MKAIMISDKPKWCALMMNGKKNIEVRKESVGKAIQKLIDEQGYADIYVYCSKNNKKHYHLIESIDTDTRKKEYEIDYYIGSEGYLDYCYEGKVAFKFRCYKVEEIACNCVDNGVGLDTYYMTEDLDFDKLEKQSCLTNNELRMYLGIGKNIQSDIVGYAIHINDLEIFDIPKELSEFKQPRDSYGKVNWHTNEYYYMELTKAPQSMCYVEVDE